MADDHLSKTLKDNLLTCIMVIQNEVIWLLGVLSYVSELFLAKSSASLNTLRFVCVVFN